MADFDPTVNLAISPAGGTPSLASAAQKSGAFYPFFEIATTYETFEGVVQLPRAGTQARQDSVVGRLCAAFAQKTVVWKAGRLRDKPTLPHWDTGNPNEILEYSKVTTMEPVLQPNGLDFAFQAEGVYRYLLVRPPKDGDPVPVAATPLFDVTVESLLIEGYRFDKLLLRCRPPSDFSEAAIPSAV